jgi:hypothetical protein
VFFEEIKLAGSIDMVFQDKYTKEFHIYDWKRLEDFLTARSTSSLKQSVYHLETEHWHAQLNTYKAMESVWDEDCCLYLIACHPDPSKTYEKIECMDLKEVGICLRSDV